MGEICMYEHVCHELVWLKMRGFYVIKSKHFFQVNSIITQGESSPGKTIR